MFFFKDLFKKSTTPSETVDPSSPVEQQISSNIFEQKIDDISFSSDKHGQQLSNLWNEYVDACSSIQSEKEDEQQQNQNKQKALKLLLHNLLKEFKQIYGAYSPAVLSQDTRYRLRKDQSTTTNSSTPDSEYNEALQVKGHPKVFVTRIFDMFCELNSSIIEELKDYSSTKTIFTYPEKFAVLEVLEIICRSQHNRAILRQTDVISKLVILIQASLSRMKILLLTDEYSDNEHPSSYKSKLLEFVKEVVTLCFKMFCAFFEAPNSLGGEMFESRLRMITLKKTNQQQISRQRAMINHLSQHNAITVLMEAMSTFQMLVDKRPNLSTFAFGLQEAALHIVRAIIYCGDGSNLDKFTEEKGLAVLVEYIWWPSELKSIMDGVDEWSKVPIEKLDLFRLKMYYEVQLLALRIMTEAVCINSKYLVLLGRLGLLDRIREMGLWVSFFFSLDEDSEGVIDALKENQTSSVIHGMNISSPQMDVVSSSPLNIHKLKMHNKTPSFSTEIKEFPCPGFIKKIANKKILQYFECVSNLISECRIVKNSKTYHRSLSNNIVTQQNAISTNKGMEDEVTEANEMEYDDKLMYFIIDMFSEPKFSGNHIKLARVKLQYYSDFQLYFMDSLVLLISRAPRLLDVLVGKRLYDLFFSEFFYYFGGVNNYILQSNEVSSLSSDKNQIAMWTSIALRESVLSFIKYASTLSSRESTEEIRKLVETIGSNEQNSALVAEVGSTLLDIMYSRYESVQNALHLMRSISVVSHAAQVQQLKLRQLNPEATDLHDQGDTSSKAIEARNIVLSILDLCLTYDKNRLLAMEDHNTLDMLVLCLFDPTLKDFSMSRLGKMMSFDTDDPSKFDVVIESFSEVFPKIRRSPSDYNIMLMLDLLRLLQTVLRENNKKHIQRAFRTKLDRILDVMNFNSNQLPKSLSLHDLCMHILRTLALLLAENAKSKVYLRDTIGMNTLRDLILHCENGKPTIELFHELLNMLVDGHFDIKSNYLICNADMIPLMFSLFLHCEEQILTQYMELFVLLIEKSTNNQHACSSISLITILLDILEQFENKFISSEFIGIIKPASGFIIDMIEVIGRHSITVKELKSFFSFIKRQSDNVKSMLLPMLLKSLQKITQRMPEAYFDFDGRKSGLYLPSISKWPSNNGYTISFWFRAENLFTSSLEVKPRLFSFINAEGHGFEGLFERDMIVMNVYMNGKMHSKTFDVIFEPKKWYFLAITHVPAKTISLTKTSNLKLYVDDKLRASVQLKYPLVSKTLDMCRIASNGRIPKALATHNYLDKEHMFQGQIASVYLFDDAITAQAIKGIYDLGPNYMSTFHFTDAALFDKSLGFMFDGSITQKIFLCFNPRARINKVILNNISELYQEETSAKLFDGTQCCITHNAKDIIGCLGGIKVLFPMLLQLDKLSHEVLDHKDMERLFDPYRVNDIIHLILDLLRGHADNQEDMVRSKGFQVIGFLLRQISPQHLTEQTIKLVPELLSVVGEKKQLYADVVKYILFDFKLWIFTKPEVQKQLISRLNHVAETQNGAKFREIVGVQTVSDVMRWFYWFKNEPDISLGDEKIYVNNLLVGSRPSDNDIVEIRQLLLKLIKTIVGFSISLDETQVFISVLATCRDPLQLQDLCRFVLEIMFLPNCAVVADYLATLNAYEVFVNLLYISNEDVRVLAVKCITRLLVLHPKTRSRVFGDQSHGFILITNILSRYPFTDVMYCTLRDVFVGAISLSNNSMGPHYEEEVEEKSHQYEIHAVLSCIFKLLLNAENDVKQLAIQDWRVQMKPTVVQDIFLRQIGWQNWLFDLLASSSSDTDLQNSAISEIIIDIVSTLLFYSLVNVKQGWRVVEETIAYLHLAEERSILNSQAITCRIYSRLLDIFCAAADRKSIQPMNAPVLDNFLHFITFIEEYLMYSNIVNHHVLNNWQTKTENVGIVEALKNLVGNPQNMAAQSPVQTTNITTTNVVSGTPEDSSILGRKQSSANIIPTPSMKNLKQRVYSTDLEIKKRKDDNGQWLDYGIASKTVHLLDLWKLNAVASFSALGNAVPVLKRLRQGGSLRIALRFIRHCIKEGPGPINNKHIDCIKQIIQRDVECELDISRFSELSAVIGDLEEGDDIQNRLLYVIYFLFDTVGLCAKKNRAEDMNILLDALRHIFSARRKLLESKLKNEDDKPVLKSNFPLFRKGILGPNEYQEILQTPGWDYSFSKHFVAAVKKVESEEQSFIAAIVKRRKMIINRVYDKMKQIIQKEEDTEKMQTADVRKFTDMAKALEQQRIKEARILFKELENTGSKLWKRIIRNVADERGPWGSQLTNDVKWKLDKTENRRRMRMRMKRDYSGVDHSGAASMDHLKNKEQQQVVDLKPSIDKEKKNVNPLLQVKMGVFEIPKLAIVKQSEKQGKEDNTIEEEEDQLKTNYDDLKTQADELSDVSDIEEKTLERVYCEIVTPMQAFSGQLEITSRRLLWYADKENKCDQFGVNSLTQELQQYPQDKVILMVDIKEIHLRRYRLRKSALEIFLTNQKNFFFNFNAADRNRIYKVIIGTKPKNLQFVHNLTSPSENLRKSEITRAWSKGLITNFDYLIALNTYAGRTYNDLSQYPVFPWILSDYESEYVDLDNPKVYRDLSLPVGALNPDRLIDLQRRYDTFSDPEIPKFLYGSHYSSSGIVLYYLIRMEPFTTYCRILQGGKFDHADRMFDSIPQTFANCLTGSDFKELIPEFFYNSEFLNIPNHLVLGVKQSGDYIGNAMLPKWAKSAEEFIRINRKALESDYVSEHLHEWIDLIFGYKQTGEAAVNAYNVFYYLTYEGTVDIDAIQDEGYRRAIIAQIENFGQTPSQLFVKPHVKRQRREDLNRALMYSPTSMSINFSKLISQSSVPLVYMKSYPDSNRLAVISQTGMVYLIKFPFTGTTATGVFDIVSKRRITFPFSNSVRVFEQSFCMPLSNKDIVFSCGHWDYSAKCTKTNTGVAQSIWRHKDLVTCMSLVEEDSILATGSKDTTVIIWDLDILNSSLPILPQPKHILYGHDDEVTCLAVDADVDVVISGSKDGTCIVHSLQQGKYVRSIKHPKGSRIELISLSRGTGYIVLFSRDDMMLHTFTLNGKLIASCDACDIAYTMTIHNEYVLYGGEKGIIWIRKLHNLKLVAKLDTSKSNSTDNYSKNTSPVRSITISPDERFIFVGLQSGFLCCLSSKI